MLNKREIYLQTRSGDQVLVEVEEMHGWISVCAAGHRVDLDPDSVFDLVDALPIVSNDISSHVDEEW